MSGHKKSDIDSHSDLEQFPDPSTGTQLTMDNFMHGQLGHTHPSFGAGTVLDQRNSLLGVMYTQTVQSMLIGSVRTPTVCPGQSTRTGSRPQILYGPRYGIITMPILEPQSSQDSSLAQLHSHRDDVITVWFRRQPSQC